MVGPAGGKHRVPYMILLSSWACTSWMGTQEVSQLDCPWLRVVCSLLTCFAVAPYVCARPEYTCWKPYANGMVLRGGAFGRGLGHEGGALLNGI